MKIKEKQPMIHLELDSKPMDFRLNFSIPESVDCDSETIMVELDNKEHEIDISINLKTETYTEKDYSKEELDIIKSLMEVIRSHEYFNFNYLRKYHDALKQQYQIKKEALENYNYGLLISYNDIFGQMNLFEVQIDNEYYHMIDQYCINPNCKCTDVALNFFKDVDKSGFVTADFSLVYNYKTGKFKDTIGIKDEHVDEIVTSFKNEIKKAFRRRHNMLKEEVKPYILRKIEQKNFEEIYYKPKKKLGRNELCYCGSGKKYKKYCLKKDLEKNNRK